MALLLNIEKLRLKNQNSPKSVFQNFQQSGCQRFIRRCMEGLREGKLRVRNHRKKADFQNVFGK